MSKPAEQEIEDLMADLDAMLEEAEAKTPAAPPAVEEPPVEAEAPAVVPPWEEPAAEAAPQPEPTPAPPPPKPVPPPYVSTVNSGPLPASAPPPAVTLAAAPTPTPTVVSPKVASMSFQIDPVQLQADTTIGEANLDEAMMQQSGLRARYGALHANAEGQAARMKAKFEIIEASLYSKHKTALAVAGEKVTDKGIDAAVKTDPLWLKAKLAMIEAETIAAANKAVTYAMADRKDMLIQLGSDRRSEMQGQLRIIAKEAENEVLRERRDAINARARQAQGQA